MEKTKDFINEKLSGHHPPAPRRLFKYRPFDDYTYEMLDNAYLFLCPAKNLDDPSECTVSFEIQDIYDINTERLNFYCVSMIMELIRPHTSEETFSKVKELISRTITANGQVMRNRLLEASFELQQYVPHEVSIALVNWLGSIPERLDEPTIRPQIERLFVGAYKAREEMGICSLTVLENCEEMWKNYTEGSSGYCVEYDMSEYEGDDALFPVIYDDCRANNIVMTIVSDFVAHLINGMSGGQLKADRSNYLRMFLTKAEKWAYQKEWRLVGDAYDKPQAPPIVAIYLGKNISETNKAVMQDYCEKRKILCIQR